MGLTAIILSLSKLYSAAVTNCPGISVPRSSRIRRSLFVSLAASRRVSSLGLNFACSSLENRWLEVS